MLLARSAAQGAQEGKRALRFECEKADPQGQEMLFCAFLLVAKGFDRVKDLHEWVRKVLLDEAAAHELKAAWKPMTTGESGWANGNLGSLLFVPMQRAMDASWPNAELDAIGISIQQWSGAEQYDNLREV
jgi:hypothetical protein